MGRALDLLKAAAAVNPATGVAAGLVQAVENWRLERYTLFLNELLESLDLELESIHERLKEERIEDLIMTALHQATTTADREHVRLLASVVADGIVGDADAVEVADLLRGVLADLRPIHLEVLAWMVPARGYQDPSVITGTRGVFRQEQIEKGFGYPADVTRSVVATLTARGLLNRDNIKVERGPSRITGGAIFQGEEILGRKPSEWSVSRLGHQLLSYLGQKAGGSS